MLRGGVLCETCRKLSFVSQLYAVEGFESFMVSVALKKLTIYGFKRGERIEDLAEAAIKRKVELQFL